MFTPETVNISKVPQLVVWDKVLMFLLLCGAVSAQQPTSLNLAQQGKNPDFAAMPFTRPVTVGTSLPTTCTIGQLYFNSAASAGSNLYECSSANTWVVIGTANASSIRGSNVSSTAPANNQALIYYSSIASYVPTTFYTLQNGLGTTATGSTNLQVNVSMGVRAVTGTSDAIISTDCGGLVTYSSASPVTVTLPMPSLGGNFLMGCPITIRNYGAGPVTLTPGASTVGGSSSQVVTQNRGCLLVSDGTNWQLGNCN